MLLRASRARRGTRAGPVSKLPEDRLPMIAETRSRKSVKRLVRFGLVWVGAAIAVAGLVGDRGLAGVWRARRQSQELTRQIHQLREENKALRETARRLREDPATIEDLARRELGLIRPGEKLFIIRDIPTSQGLSP